MLSRLAMNRLVFCSLFYTGPRVGRKPKITAMNDALSTLNWLVEAGADEAVAEQPVNRLKPSAPVGEGAGERMKAEAIAPLTCPSQAKPATATLSHEEG